MAASRSCLAAPRACTRHRFAPRPQVLAAVAPARAGARRLTTARVILAHESAALAGARRLTTARVVLARAARDSTARAARLSSTPSPAPAPAASGVSRADLARYATYAAGGAAVWIASSVALSTITGILHVSPATMARYGFYAGFAVAGAAAVVVAAGYQRIHIRPEFVYRAALGKITNSKVASEVLGAPKAGGLRAYNLDGGNFFATRASPLGVEWKPPRVVMMFALSGDKADGVASLECVKRLDGSLDFGFIGVDVFNENEDRLLVSGSVDRMTEKADKLRELSIRKYR